MTVKESFLTDRDVSRFIDWLHAALPTLDVNLNIAPSPKVPGGVLAQVRGIDVVVSHYKWKANWTIPPGRPMPSDDWATTQNSLRALSQALRRQVGARDDQGVLAVCDAILRWGGDRNPQRGAYPFLHGLRQPAQYIADASAQLRLSSADLTKLKAIRRMNSMLTKVHALASDDGLPIYDSRVAVAIASMVEIYRSCNAPAWRSVPTLLQFPSLDASREVRNLFTGALSHDSLETRSLATTLPWARAKIRLGWLMQEVLRRDNNLFVDRRQPTSSMSLRMHAFEAALFMIGYDARCLAANFCNPPVAGVVLPSLARAKRAQPRKPAAAAAKPLTTLARGNPFQYWGTREQGLCIQIGRRSCICLSPAFIEEIVQSFSDAGWVNAGFSRGAGGAHRVSDSSFGSYIETNSEQGLGQKLTRQHAARIASVLVDLTVCRYRKHGRSLQLQFDPTAS